MEKIQEHIHQIWLKRLASIDKKTLDDIYAFSFFVYNDNNDPRFPTLIIGFNTISNFKANIALASNELEAKWNYAFWIQNEIASIGNDEDEAGRSIIEKWISNLGLNYSNEEEDKNMDECLEKGKKITAKFINVLIQLVQTFHESTPTKVPILIHELEYYDEIRDQNILANGEELVKEFSDWINDMYH